ncbi:MAG: cysteine peptidase family C39 domain-containing protein, partial [Cyanobacteria bacterium P01_E01_bin.45]
MKNTVKQSKKLRCVTQMSEEDCGAACLATVCKFYGRYLGLNQSREIIGTGQLGTSLLGLRRGAESLGFNTRAVKASSQILDRLGETVLPSIIHWKGYHWVVLYGRRRKR